jgi:tRNA (guanine37-N1)-methyltransferase
MRLLGLFSGVSYLARQLRWIGMNSGPAAPRLDKRSFDRHVPLVALRIPAKMCTLYMNRFREHLFQRPRMKRIFDAPEDPDKRLLLLSETLSSVEDLTPDLKQFLLDNGPAQPEPYSLKLGYEHLSVEEVLRAVLPKGMAEIPSSYEQAGHIAHLNLRDEMLPFKHLVGQVILDKNPALRTVVNKMGNIENEFRTFPMEILAGDDDLQVTMRESGARFSFNFRNVYWNSRLQTEHARLIQLVKDSASSSSQKVIVADMMAGVGPFAVPLAMHGRIAVHANDLNPDSYASLVQNAKTNHCGSNLQPYNQDARDFIIGIVKDGLRFTEAIMNLPANATDFLDVFIGLGRRGEWLVLPRIHVYAFSVSPDPVADIVDRVASVLRCPVEALGYSSEAAAAAETPEEVDALACWGHIVRDVSPKKMMVCLTFRLPREVAEAEIVVKSGSKRGAQAELEEDATEFKEKRPKV